MYGTDKNTTIKWLDVKIIRNRRLKSKTEIENLDNQSTDLYYPSMIDIHYPNRPTEMENTNLFNFASKYDIVKKKPHLTELECYEYPGYGFIKKRPRSHLIKHPIYNWKLEPEKYFHSLLMLFKPWREESELLGVSNTYFEAFMLCKNTVESAIDYHKHLQYLITSKDDINKIIEELQNNQNSHTTNETNDELQINELEEAMEELQNNEENVETLVENLTG